MSFGRQNQLEEKMGIPTQASGKGSSQQSRVVQPSTPNPMAMGQNVTFPGQGGQPQMGAPNPYANTIVSSDNQYNSRTAGKGKGA
jgi:hypothetical protein